MSTPDFGMLSRKRCQPCEGGVKPLSQNEAKKYLASIPGWNLREDSKSIWREYVMKDFMSAVGLIDRMAQAAESEDHHPDVHLTAYRKLRIELATHAIGGLSENDFILAAKIEQLPKVLKTSG